MLKIFNTLSRKKEIFTPINKKKVRIYVCGVTPYDICHIGHGRTFIVFDIIIRYLKFLGYKVYYIRNITDIDDKIIELAKKKNKSIKYVTQNIIKKISKDFNNLNITSPNFEPKVTDHIKDIIFTIKKLLINNTAYIAKNGDIMFSIKKYPNYGILSKQNTKLLKLNIKIKNFNVKKNYKDFVLWKLTNESNIGWDSPWGYGRPGWHIECSTLSYKYLGKNFDIHGGGSDLMFPHHENEIAQSFCIDKKFYVNYWIHTGMIIINNTKMSKSLKNTFKIKDILSKYNEEVIRYFLTITHYRKPIIFSENKLKQAQLAIQKLYTSLFYKKNIFIIKNIRNNFFLLEQKFYESINDDFNTPKAYSILFKISKKINIAYKQKKYLIANYFILKLKKLGNILGILFYNPKNYLQNNKNSLSFYGKDKIEKLIKKRNIARIHKLWAEADLIRNKLKKNNILLEDTNFGTIWKKKI
ncbi:cysteine--tRNA ligase [Enterobacteriaceae endosymbiont of Donacia bicoloricornis]|uniref:cysteine--tRNA ligase n=1 Tax=Enterobacteriaceae endosymbiont of Donacia bicoloricornis TaxID=2675772 RepID=UPI0014499CA7|nr:cysteine--tRNA ligase [Enterobacteriaceae endosymbiont of Donacia bicoloricornis]QJC37578.1 cysteine--tRNA ligase [Enterobacteriaceae endosymbiont of Donacia bicoloricornis]